MTRNVDNEPCFCDSGKKYIQCHGKGPAWVGWPGFTDEQLSMIASHIAGGGSFCCPEHEEDRRTVTGRNRQRQMLSEFAYEYLGCHPNDKANHERYDWYLDKFLGTV